MKKRGDPRHKARVDATKTLFENIFRPQSDVKNAFAKDVIKKQRQIDKIIEKDAPAWPIKQILPVDLAILRLAIFELLYKDPKEPYKVIIDEAVEIAKEFGGESSPSFINGVLGTVVKANLETNIK